MTDPEEVDKGQALEKVISNVADNLKSRYGPDAAVVVMVGIPDGDHHLKRWAWRGRCLMVEGLCYRSLAEIMATLGNAQSPPKEKKP